MNYSYTFFSTNNLPNTAQQGEKKHNCYSLYNICHCTASAVLSEGHWTIFRFCHVLPPLGSWTRIRRFSLTASSVIDLLWELEQPLCFSEPSSKVFQESSILRRDFIRWLGGALPFLVWNSVIGLMELLPLGDEVRWSGRCRRDVSP